MKLDICSLLRSAIVAAVLGIAQASAEEWYTLTHETTDVTFSIQDEGDHELSVWLRFREAAGAGERRLLFSITCSPPTAGAIEARRYDSSGDQVQLRRVPADAFADQPWLPVLSRAVCEFTPAPIPPRDVDASVTEASITRMLRSEHEAERRRAVDIVLSEPGVFTPLTFVHVASALLEQGREDEALQWYAFGYMRMVTDMRAAARVDPRYEQTAALISPMYGSSASLELGQKLDQLNDTQAATMMMGGFSRDEDIPRLYPVDWFLSPISVMAVPWGSPASPRPGTDFAVRRELDAARNELRSAATSSTPGD